MGVLVLSMTGVIVSLGFRDTCDEMDVSFYSVYDRACEPCRVGLCPGVSSPPVLHLKRAMCVAVKPPIDTEV